MSSLCAFHNLERNYIYPHCLAGDYAKDGDIADLSKLEISGDKDLEEVYVSEEECNNSEQVTSPSRGDLKKITQLVQAGNFPAVLQDEICQRVLGMHRNLGKQSISITEYFRNNLTYCLKNGKNKDAELHHLLLCFGISSLQLFIQSNFTGPLVGGTVKHIMVNIISENENWEVVQKEALNELVGDAEYVYPLLTGPEYLILARVILTELKDMLKTCISVDWWCVRCLIIHQKVTGELSPQIYENILQALNSLEKNEKLLNISDSRDVVALFHLEALFIHLSYQNVSHAQEHLNKVKCILKVDIAVSGALGKRTKWQQEEKAQLVVKVQYEGCPVPSKTEEPPAILSNIPKDIILMDDTRLNKIKFKDTDVDVISDLNPVEQAVLLADLMIKRKSQAQEAQVDEETKAYLSAVLQHPKTWSVQFSALLMRCYVEAKETRAMERSLNQLEELVSAVNRAEPSGLERVQLFFACPVLPHWELHQHLARMLVRLGCVKMALETFEKLQLWEDVILCYNELQMRHKSAEIIHKLLEKKVTAKLLCLLGDATDDITCYLKAWKLSNFRSCQAQRCLGNYYYVRKAYKDAILPYKKSLDINYLQFRVWQRLGFCALQVEDWELCAQAYRRCSVLEPDSFECWNNMSQAYLKLDQKHRAWKTLQEALRCRMDSWKLWDNFMLVSISLGYTAHALNAYFHILTLKEKHVDTQILGRIVQSVVQEKMDPDGQEMKNMYKTCSQLLARLTSEVPANSELWFLYGNLLSAYPQPSQETHDNAVKCYRKSVAGAVQISGWEKDPVSVVMNAQRSLHLLKAVFEAVKGVSKKSAATQLRSVRMLVKGVLISSKKGQFNIATSEINKDVKIPLKNLEDGIKRLEAEISQLES